MVSTRQPVFTGVGVSLITVFHGDGSLDAPRTADLACRLIDLGVKAIILADAPGEGPALSASERQQLLDAVRAAVPRSAAVPIIAATGCASAGQAARLTKEASDHGADAVLVHSPLLRGDGDSYYREVAAAAGSLPVLAQHHPGLAPPGIQLPELPLLRVDGYEDVAADAERLLETLEIFDGPVYTGSSAMLSLAGPAGAAGAMLALANAEPERCATAFGGDGSEQRGLARGHIEAQVDFPEGLKAMVARRFGTSTTVRMG
jgi:dihydrodipicolinate synthase/N-acetylneuraminate lyase